jgi:hypothetical protein
MCESFLAEAPHGTVCKLANLFHMREENGLNDTR